MADMSLSDVLQQLREELALAQEKAKDESLKFTVKDIEVELQVATTQEADGKVGFKVWLLEGGIGGKQGHEQTHKIKLRLEPPQLPDGSGVKVSAERKAGTP
ncbi:MAG: trypco2 family protein [Candidatus Methylumidiphilus sp.]